METTSIRYDAIVIGTGPAGPSLAQRVGSEGLRVAVVERDEIGGACVNVGCIPTKALLDGLAGRADSLTGDGHGQIDMSELVARVTSEVKRVSQFDQDPALVIEADVPAVVTSVQDQS